MLASLSQAQGGLYPLPTDRFGADFRRDRGGTIAAYDVALLHIGWYSDWGVSLNPPRPGGIEYVQLVWVANGQFMSLTELGPMVDANPGSLWMIGNEPECIHQGNNTPEQYAQAYHQLYTFIKARDAGAQVAIGGVVQPTPLRLEWLNLALNAYQTAYGQPMPVDVWNIHNMILPEVRDGWGCEIPRGLEADSGRLYTVDDNDNIDIFTQHIIDFRTWMSDRGQRNKPLIISEYGVLMPSEYGFPAARVNAYMNATFDFMLAARDEATGYPADENRLVQRWAWFSLNDRPWNPDTGAGFNGALFDYRYSEYPGVLTSHGVNFKAYTDALLRTDCAIQGSVALQGRPSPPSIQWSIPLTVTVASTSFAVTTDQSGNFTISGLMPGIYNIKVKNGHTLANIRRNVTIVSGNNSVHLGTLLEGDADNNNIVNIVDFSILRSGFSPGFDPRADFNDDGVVNITDFSLLRTNFYRVGDIVVSVP